MKRLREEAIQYKTELEELKLVMQLQEDERDLRRKGKYKEEELHDLETEALEQETHVRFEGVSETALALEEMIAGGELKEKRWESITRSYVSTQGFTDVRDKLMFIENLLGETEKLIWMQWRMRYADEYANLIAIGDGNEGTQNIDFFVGPVDTPGFDLQTVVLQVLLLLDEAG